MFLRRTSAAAKPVSLFDAREHLRVTSSVEDYQISQAIDAAADAVAQWTGRALGPETWTLALAGAAGDVCLPLPPVQSITGIAYFDPDDVSQTADVADFYFFSGDDRAVLRPKPGKSWPVTAAREDAITITFVAGYDVLPPALRSAVMLMIGHFFENRAAVVAGVSVAELPIAVESMVALYRRGWVAA